MGDTTTFAYEMARTTAGCSALLLMNAAIAGSTALLLMNAAIAGSTAFRGGHRSYIVNVINCQRNGERKGSR